MPNVIAKRNPQPLVEFKGGGIISPSITNPSEEGTITYEINPSLIH